MRNLINIINESARPVDEDCVEQGKVWKSSWTTWRDRDGIYLLRPGSNSCWVGFCDEKEAREFAETLEGDWRVHRNGRYRELTDDEVKADPEIRMQRIKYGMWVEPLTEEPLSEQEFVEKTLNEFRKLLD